eukprot:CAMPEP_0172588314 /NCGR_PEP_ID=MMETSP1068-20121228/7230_1 /TAXON_ID=35684 /ORGANISM="Pseudopedinella elastica, Strain CCMP716" /LENGTH=137 /DNA_ID=CAMNT_0013383599 /DNA_START=395 /DNA_END=808 /DNA_ORIENTATION=-
MHRTPPAPNRFFSVSRNQTLVALKTALQRPVVPLVEPPALADSLRVPRVLVRPRHRRQRQLAGLHRPLQPRGEGHVDFGRFEAAGPQELARRHCLHPPAHREGHVAPPREARFVPIPDRLPVPKENESRDRPSPAGA